MTLIEVISDAYGEFLKSSDSRVTSWLLMDNPVPIVTLIIMYVTFCKIIGPAWMKNKKPFDLRKVMVFYNAVVVLYHVYFIQDMCVFAGRPMGISTVQQKSGLKVSYFDKLRRAQNWKTYTMQAVLALLRIFKSSGICMEQEENHPDSIRITELGWWFLAAKIMEFADTVFFVLRKKFHHISKFHIVHHSITPLFVWISFRIEPAGYNYFFPLINSLVHTTMYTYYGLAALGPAVKRYLWWKKYLTTFQIVQFIIVSLYYLALNASNCKVSKWINFLTITTSLLFIVLFINFFKNTYTIASDRKSSD